MLPRAWDGALTPLISCTRGSGAVKGRALVGSRGSGAAHSRRRRSALAPELARRCRREELGDLTKGGLTREDLERLLGE